jgi:ABC-type phosphate transport system substrate-binding protein
MNLLTARRTLSAGIIAGASVVAFALPSAASALPGHCAGTSTEGAGSSFQLEAQEVYKVGFNKSKAGCIAGPKIGYRSVGSGAGYQEWNKEQKYGTVGFVGTDNTVNAAEKLAVENEVDSGKSSKLLTVPVVQGAEAIVMNLPANCVANSAVATGRLGITQATLTGIYEGTVTKWSEIVADPNTGNELKSTESGTCNPETAITPIVRKDSSGTTHIFKKFLFRNDAAALENECAPAASATLTWGELAEGTKDCTAGAESRNQAWPLHLGVAVVKHASTTTNTGVLQEVAAIPGSIGYADLAQARNAANGGFTGQSPQRFWAVLESSQKVKNEVVASRKFADPSTNKDVGVTAESNCKKTEYTNGTAAFPPLVTDAWNEAAAKQFSKTYPLCGLTYVLVNSNYAAYASHGGNEKEAQTVSDYTAFITSKKGGGKEIKSHDYAALPKELVEKGEEAVSLITD